MSNISDILKERQKTHGEYAEHARCTQRIMDALVAERGWDDLPAMIKETLHMNAHKLGRIVTGNPYVKDHYDDISGYAQLISERLIDKVGIDPMYVGEGPLPHLYEGRVTSEMLDNGAITSDKIYLGNTDTATIEAKTIKEEHASPLPTSERLVPRYEPSRDEIDKHDAATVASLIGEPKVGEQRAKGPLSGVHVIQGMRRFDGDWAKVRQCADQGSVDGKNKMDPYRNLAEYLGTTRYVAKVLALNSLYGHVDHG